MLWRQKSRIIWLRTPDLNTHFFSLIHHHSKTVKLYWGYSRWFGYMVIWQKDIGRHMEQYFRHLFAGNSVAFAHHLDNLIPKILTAEDNTKLCRSPTNLEIWRQWRVLVDRKHPGQADLQRYVIKNIGRRWVVRYLVWLNIFSQMAICLDSLITLLLLSFLRSDPLLVFRIIAPLVCVMFVIGDFKNFIGEVARGVAQADLSNPECFCSTLVYPRQFDFSSRSYADLEAKER